MRFMRGIILKSMFIVAMAALPATASAAGLSAAQAGSIVGLLRAFGAEAAVITAVENMLAPAPSTVPADPPAPAPVRLSPSASGSPYLSSNLGYDLSYSTHAYPTIPFGFGVVGVTGGKAFVHNSRAASEYSWAQFGSSAPTVYLNLNAPYGSTATSAHMSVPKTCDSIFTGSTSPDGYPEPTVCGAYDYGYAAAKDAYAYANGQKVSSRLWWLDIEEANSWSSDTAVNDAVIQGAMDYLNSQGLRVGIYSVPYMWKNIAGSGFSPSQAISGAAITTPTWFPIGISTRVGAINSCLSRSSFIPGSPVWIIQYEDDATSVDRNIAC